MQNKNDVNRSDFALYPVTGLQRKHSIKKLSNQIRARKRQMSRNLLGKEHFPRIYPLPAGNAANIIE